MKLISKNVFFCLLVNVRFDFELKHRRRLMFHRKLDRLDQMLHLYLYSVESSNWLLYDVVQEVVRLTIYLNEILQIKENKIDRLTT